MWNYTPKQLTEMALSARLYSGRAGHVKEIQKGVTKTTTYLTRRANTPEGYKSQFFFVKVRKNLMATMAYAIIDDYEGETFVRMEKSGVLIVVHAHAIKRYYERHGFDGTFEQCRDFLLLKGFIFINIDVDEYTKETLSYFDDGVFMGIMEENVWRVKTWIKNTQCYQNQRLASFQSQKEQNKLVEDAKERNGLLMNALNNLDFYKDKC